MNSATDYIKAALVNALTENNYTAVITIAETLNGLPTNGNGHKPITQALRSLPEPKRTPSIGKSRSPMPVPVTGSRGKFSRNDEVHSISEYRIFSLNHVIPMFNNNDIFTSREYEEYFSSVAEEQQWFLELDFVKIKSGGKPGRPVFKPRWKVMIRCLLPNMRAEGLLTRVPNPNGKNSHVHPATYQINLPLVTNDQLAA